MKKLASVILSAFIALSSISVLSVNAMAAEIIPVYLNNELIAFDSGDAQPQIYTYNGSGRTYVPIRKTAETLGLSIAWNAKTETLTFTREGMTVAHTMRSNIVYVNGQSTTFDTPSINVQNRTLMPIRMLAESIGAEVEWDATRRCVYITTENPAVVSAEATPTVVKSGEKLTVKANVNSATDKVKLVDSDDNSVIAEVSEPSSDDSNGKVFIYEWTTPAVDDTALKSVIVYAGDSAGYNEAADSYKKLPVCISKSDAKEEDDDDDKEDYETIQSDYMVDYEIEEDEVVVDDSVKLTVTTTDEVSGVKLENSFNTKRSEVTKYTEDDDDNRVFEITQKMSKKGSGELYIYLKLEDAGYETVYQAVPIKIVDEDDDDEKGEMEIIDVEIYEDTVYKGELAYITVYTSTDIEYIEVYDEDDDKVGEANFRTGVIEGESVWDVDFEINHSDRQEYTVKAFIDEEEVDEDEFRISGDTYSKNDLVIISVTQKSADVREGDDCKLTVKTTSLAEKVVVTTENGDELDSAESSSKKSSTKTFTLSVEVDDVDDEYYVYAYDEDDNKTSKKVKLRIEPYEEAVINSVEVDDSTVDLGDDVVITVYTSQAVEKVWVEDLDEERVSQKASKPDDETDDEYIWELDFEAEEKGSRVQYVVIAEGEDDEDIDDYTFRIKVS